VFYFWRWLCIGAGALLWAVFLHAETPVEGTPDTLNHERIDPLACGPVYRALYFEAAMAYLPNELLPYWCWLSAQGKAESAYNPEAVSSAKARGVAQFMDATWREVCLPKFGVRTPYELVPAIRCQALYMGRLAAFWTWDRPASSRLRLATACYNAGCGNVYSAQKKCVGARHWDGIAPCLKQVTGSHSAETIGYVARIEGFYRGFTGVAVPEP